MNRLSGEVEGIEMKFRDTNLEELFHDSRISQFSTNSSIFSGLIAFIYFISIFYDFKLEDYELNSIFYILASGFLIEILVGILTLQIKKKYTLKHYLKHTRFLCFISIFYYALLYTSMKDLEIVLRNLYGLYFFNSFALIFFLYFNYVILIGIPLINAFLLWYIQYKLKIPNNSLLADTIGNFMINLSLFWYKKMDYSNQKTIFYEKYKNENYVYYIHQLIDKLDKMLISVKKDEILFLNSTALKFITNHFFKHIPKMITVSSTLRDN